ncbi:hypothetical protein Pcaca04_18810 [Pectobacterium carotovorum subsp. carotovorum]|nr:hypothetical protein Pcaca04_18810 [Pectobacterium carotovorum subsp. carotovorum]
MNGMDAVKASAASGARRWWSGSGHERRRNREAAVIPRKKPGVTGQRRLSCTVSGAYGNGCKDSLNQRARNIYGTDRMLNLGF